MRHVPWVLVVGAGLACLGGSHGARASNFDPTTGKLTLDDAALADGLDAVATGANAPTWLVFRGGAPLVPVDPAPLFRPDDSALEGSGFLGLGNGAVYAFMKLPPRAALMGRRVEVRLWTRARGTAFKATLQYIAGDPDSLIVGDGLDGLVAGYVALAPSGRATDDGWVELSSGPIDYALGGVLAPTMIRLIDEQVRPVFSRNVAIGLVASARADFDAFEIVDVGPSAVPVASCSIVDERTVCGETGVCAYGRCVDAGTMDGGILPAGPTREDYLAVRRFQMQAFQGARAFRPHAAEFDDLMHALTTAAPRDAAEGLRKAFALTANIHTLTPWSDYGVASGGLDPGACLGLGLADLVPLTALPDNGVADPRLTPLLFSVTPGTPLAELLAPGDALVAIDGMSVAEWRASAQRVLEYVGDPTSRFALEVSAIMSGAMATGAKLTFLRCAEPLGCTAEQTQEIVIDLAAVYGDPIWNDLAPPGRAAHTSCDGRFHPAVPSDARYDPNLMAARQDGDVALLQFNSMPLDPTAMSQWFDAFGAALASTPPKVLMDMRRGSGGLIALVGAMENVLFAPDDAHTVEFVPWLATAVTDAHLGAWRTCFDTYAAAGLCGYFMGFVWPAAPEARGVGASRLAVLMGDDKSASEMLLKDLEFRKGPTRRFGSSGSTGSLGSACYFAPVLGEVFGGGYQCTDEVVGRATSTAPHLKFQSGHGVQPDVLIYQTQSDAIADRDTLLEAALSWLAEVSP